MFPGIKLLINHSAQIFWKTLELLVSATSNSKLLNKLILKLVYQNLRNLLSFFRLGLFCGQNRERTSVSLVCFNQMAGLRW